MSAKNKVSAVIFAAVIVTATPFIAKWEGVSTVAYRDIVGVPTITGVTNVASVTTPATQFQYSRVGNTVTVSGRIQFAATAATTDTTVGISLPIASTITSVYFVTGVGACVSTNAFGESGAVTGDSTNNRASFLCRPSATASRLWSVHFTYKIA